MESPINEIETTAMNGIICPTDTEWRFKKSDLFALMDSENLKKGFLNGKCFYAFNIPGLQYYIRIFPNGDNEKRRGHPFISLHLNGLNERKITANFVIFIETADYSEYFNYVYEKDEGWGKVTDFKTSEFFDSENKFFVKGEIAIRIKGILKAEGSSTSVISCPISMQWNIKKEDLKAAKNKKENGFLQSKKFKVANSVEYCLFIYPNEKKDGKKEAKTNIYLNIHLGCFTKTIEAVYDFSIENISFNRGFKSSFENSCGYGTEICLTDLLFDRRKRFIVDGILTINFQGILMTKNECFEEPFISFYRNSLILAASEQENLDFTIVIGDKEIKVHKKLLMEASPVLTGMFDSGMMEAKENKMNITDCSFEIVDAAIKLCYSTWISHTCILDEILSSLSFTFEQLLSLYQFADKYQISFIMDTVEYNLKYKLSPANLCQLIQFSKDFNITKLYQKCVNFMLKCSRESTPVYGLETFDKEMIYQILLSTFRPIVDYNFDVN